MFSVGQMPPLENYMKFGMTDKKIHEVRLVYRMDFLGREVY